MIEALGEIALARLTERLEQQLRDDQAEYPVAEKFQTLVVAIAVAAQPRTRMRQRPPQQGTILEAVSDPRFECSVFANLGHKIT